MIKSDEYFYFRERSNLLLAVFTFGFTILTFQVWTLAIAREAMDTAYAAVILFSVVAVFALMLTLMLTVARSSAAAQLRMRIERKRKSPRVSRGENVKEQA